MSRRLIAWRLGLLLVGVIACIGPNFLFSNLFTVPAYGDGSGLGVTLQVLFFSLPLGWAVGVSAAVVDNRVAPRLRHGGVS